MNFRPWVPLCVVFFLFVLFLATTVHLHYPHVNVLSAIMTYHEFYISIVDFTSVNLSPSENSDLRATNFIAQSSENNDFVAAILSPSERKVCKSQGIKLPFYSKMHAAVIYSYFQGTDSPYCSCCHLTSCQKTAISIYVILHT